MTTTAELLARDPGRPERVIRWLVGQFGVDVVRSTVLVVCGYPAPRLPMSARRTDPATSQAAAEAVAHKRSLRFSAKSRSADLLAVFRYGSPKSAEEASRLVLDPEGDWTPGQWEGTRRRVSDLHRLGLIGLVGTRMGDSGVAVQTYVITDAGRSACEMLITTGWSR